MGELAEKYGLSVDPEATISELFRRTAAKSGNIKSAYRNVELLILDEPTGVLTPQETEQLF